MRFDYNKVLNAHNGTPITNGNKDVTIGGAIELAVVLHERMPAEEKLEGWKVLQAVAADEELTVDQVAKVQKWAIAGNMSVVAAGALHDALEAPKSVIEK